MAFLNRENRPSKEVLPGVRLRTFWGEKMLLALVDLDSHATVPAHSHLHEQSGILLSGELELTIAGEARRLSPGDMYLIPGGVEHSARTSDVPAQVLDVFSPVREEYKF